MSHRFPFLARLALNPTPVLPPPPSAATPADRSHSDIRAYLGWLGPYHAIGGHEGVGVVVAPASSDLLGKRVGVKWVWSSCGACKPCRRNNFMHCAAQQNTGKQVQGTLAQYVTAPTQHLSVIPAGLGAEVAAPLLCAGLTMVGALAALPDFEPGDWVVVQGAGGGLGHLGVQLAKARGLRVIAVDTGDAKRALSLECGADAFVDFRNPDAEDEVRRLTNGEGADACLVVPGELAAFEAAPGLVRNGGAIVVLGLPRNDYTLPLSISRTSARGLTVRGVAVGTEEQMDELLRLAAEGKVKPLVEVHPFERIGDVMEDLKHDRITGRAVVTLPP